MRDIDDAVGKHIDICLLGRRLTAVATGGAGIRPRTAGVTADDMRLNFGGAETAPDLNVAAIRQRALDRVKSARMSRSASKRHRVAPN